MAAIVLMVLLRNRLAAQSVSFTNVTVSAGITYSLPPSPPNIGDFVASQAGGASAGDYDNDGWVDLFVSRPWDAPVLYRNNHNGTFDDVTAAAFPAGLTIQGSNGVGWGDIDNDGDSDLYVTSTRMRNHLFINDGAGHFTEQAVMRGAYIDNAPAGGTSVSLGDYDNDGYLDMYVGEWRVLSNPYPPHTRLLHNLGAANPGFFEDVTIASGAAMGPLSGQSEYGALAFTPRFVDFDRDGNSDILVASDSHSTKLFWNNGDGTFTDGTSAIASLTGFSDMGLAIGDVDGNGWLDWMTTDVYAATDASTGNRLFRNYGNRQFLETSVVSGVRNAGWGWGNEMLDYDNDKDIDLVATNGFYIGEQYHHDAVRLWRNDNGITFTEVAPSVGITDTGQGRGLLTFDYDHDGDLDVFIVNNYSSPVLYRNDGGNQNNWLQIETVGTISNADGVGAFITVTPDLDFPNKKMVREVSASSSYLSQSEAIAHFGLGTAAEPIDLIRIEWPATGIVQELRNVDLNQRLTVTEQFVGDFNGDGAVDAADFTVWQDSLGQTVAHGTLADADGDGLIDIADYQSWKAHFAVSMSGGGSLSGATASVPEPAATTLACAAALLYIPLRKKSR